MTTWPLDARTLILIPCCAAKASGGSQLASADPLAGLISPAIYAQLLDTRRGALAQVRQDATLLTEQFAKNRLLQDGPEFGGLLTVGRYLPALERYTGTLYSVPGLRPTLSRRIHDRLAPRLMILSALYGPLHPLSPIQDYNLRMDQAPARVWRTAFLPILESYVRNHQIRSIVLLLGSMTPYYRVASAAVSALLRRGLVEETTQYHVIDGNTRTTPLEHGRALHELFLDHQLTSSRIEARQVSATISSPSSAPTTIVHPARSVLPASRPLEPSDLPRMRRAPPPNASAAQIARTVTLNASARPAPSPRPVAIPVVMPVHATPTSAPRAPVVADLLPRVAAPTRTDVGGQHARLRTLFERLLRGPDQGLPLARLLDTGRLPNRGVYFFLDPMTDANRDAWRISRVGTHAVSLGSKSTLRARLRAHLGARNGNGNHRGSIFRLHVGHALLRREQLDIATWGVGSSAPPLLRESEGPRDAEGRHEQRVSDYIGQLPVLWVSVPDDASPSSDRSVIERNTIALLSRHARLSPGVADGWLGEHSPRSEIRSSRLWNLNYVDDDFDPAFFEVLEQAVARTVESTSGPLHAG